MAEIDWTVAGPLVAQMLAQIVIAERQRTGLPTEQIFENAGRKLDENELKLLEDIERLKGI